MKEYIVSLNVRSRVLDLAEIIRLMGAEPSGSHVKGDLNAKGNACYASNFWCLNAEVEEDATIDAQLDFIEAKLTQKWLGHDPQLLGDLEIWVSVGVMYDTYTASVMLSSKLIRFANDLGAGIEVSTYPTEFDQINSLDLSLDRTTGRPSSDI
jgi:hypothetical protein